jgi:biotin transport system substrate-specific component
VPSFGKKLILVNPLVEPWKIDLRWVKRIPMTLLFAILTGLCAQIRFYLPFTPVPVTGQVFAVLLSGVFLGKEFGSLSQLVYLVFGLLGIPWFVIGPLGPTGGYIVGFIVAPYIIGALLEKTGFHIINFRTDLQKKSSKNHPVVLIMLSMMSGVAIIYLFGLIQFAIYTQNTLRTAIRLAVLPFLPFDLGKAALAAAITRFFLKK